VVLNYIEKKSSKLNAIFKGVKINFGCKFGDWVSFHTAILQFWKSQENLGRAVVEFPLLE